MHTQFIKDDSSVIEVKSKRFSRFSTGIFLENLSAIEAAVLEELENKEIDRHTD